MEKAAQVLSDIVSHQASIRDGLDIKDPISILPYPSDLNPSDLGSVSLDLRLGRWFLTLRRTKHEVLDISVDQYPSEPSLADRHFVNFGDKFVLHPGSFVLGATLEWVRMPGDTGAYVSGKSALGRRGLIIETAMGIHPGFSGCVTLEIANLGEIPIALRPGMKICQVYFHKTQTHRETVTPSLLAGHRRPVLGEIKSDYILASLSPKV